MTAGQKRALGAVVAVLVVLGITWATVTSASLHVVSGLSFPVVVTVDGKPHRVEPGNRLVLSGLLPGAHELVTRRDDGFEVEQLTAQLGLIDDNVYNVLGAAPLERVTVYYGSPGSTPEPQSQSGCATASFQAYDVNLVFEEPPRTVEVPQGASYASRTVLRLAGEGLPSCLSSPRVEPLAQAELAAKVAAVTPSADERRALLYRGGDAFARAGRPERAVALAQALLDDPKSTLEDHRLVQDLYRAAGRLDELVERYRTRFEQQPSAASAYLYARLADAPEALRVVDAALGDAPKDTWLHRVRLWCADQLLRWDDVVAEADFFLARDDVKDAHPWAQMLRLRALVGLGRAGEALEDLKRRLDGEKRWSAEDAVLVERVAARAGQRPWVDPFTRLGDPSAQGAEREMFKYFYELSAGHQRVARPPSATLATFDVLAAARTNPAQALTRLKALDPAQELYLLPEQAWVLLAEAWRVGDAPAAERLSRFAPGAGDGLGLKKFIDEGDERPLRDATLEGRLASMLARSRTLAARGDAEGAKAMAARLEAADPLRGLAVLALTEWDAEARPEEETVQQLKQLQPSGALPDSMRTAPRRK
ncbi:MAG: hypothetical protein AB1730_16870 [Myxococcota bacterium]|jgi:tetratricopeptide (TPR) repeat protein